MGKLRANFRRMLSGLVVATMLVTNIPVNAYAAGTSDDAIASISQSSVEQETDFITDEDTDNPDAAPSGGTSEEVKEPSEEEASDKASYDASNEEGEEASDEEATDDASDEESGDEASDEASEELSDEELPVTEEEEDKKLVGASSDYVWFDGSIGDELNNYHFDYHDFNGKRVCVLDNAGGYKMRGYEFETGIRAGLYYQGDLVLVLRGDNDITMQNIDGGDNRQSYGIYVTGKLTLIASGNATLKVSSAQAKGVSCGIYAGSIEMPKSSPVSGTFKFQDYTETPDVNLGSCSASGLTVNASHGGGGSGYIYAVNTKNAASTIEAGTLNLSGTRAIESGYALTVTGGTINATCPIHVKNLTVKGGSVKSDSSNCGSSSSSPCAIQTETLTITGGSVEGRSPKGCNLVSGIQCNTLNISGGNIYAYGNINTSSTASYTNPFVQGILTTSMNMTGGSVIAYGGNVGSALVEGSAIRFRDGEGTRSFTGGTIEAYGGTIDSGNTEGASYGLCGGSDKITLSGTKLTARGYTNAFGKSSQESLDAGCIVVGTGTTASNLKPLGYGSHNYSELKQYKYLIAGTEAQMKAINSSYVPQKRDISESVIYLDGDYASNKSYYYTGKTETVNVTVKLAGVDITNLVKFSTNTGTALSGGKPTYLNAGSYTLTATANDSRYTGSVSCALKVRGMELDSLSASVTSGAVTYNGSEDFKTYSVTVSVKGTKNGTTYTLSESEYTKSFGKLDTSSATSAVAGTVPITIKTKSGTEANHTYSASVKADLTVNKAASTMTLSQSSISTFVGNRIDLSNYVKNSQGTLSYTIAQNLTGCGINGSTLICGSTAGTCKVTITDAGSTYYRSGSKTITINVSEKASNNLTVTMENVKKTGKNTFVGMTSAASGSSIPDPVYNKVSGATDVTLTYSGKLFNGVEFSPSGSKPTKPGKYTVTVAYHTDTADYSGSADFYIKGDLSSDFINSFIVWDLNSYYATYDGNEVNVSVQTCASHDGYLTEGNHYQFKSGKTATDAGTYTAVIEPATEYFTGERSFTWSIAKKNPQREDFDLPELTDSYYDGTSKKIATPKLAGKLTGCGDLSVYYKDESGTIIDDPVNAGYYFAYLKIPGGKNFNADEFYVGGFAVYKVADPAVINEYATVTAGGNTVDLKKNVTNNVGDVTFEHDGVDTGCSVDPLTGLFTSGDKPTVAFVRVIIAETTNYYESSNEFIKVTVTEKGSKPLTVKQSDGTYGSTLPDPVFTKPSGTQSVRVFYSGHDHIGNYYESESKPTNVGNYTVHVACEAKTEIYEGTADFKVNPKDISKAVIILSSTESEYDGYAKIVTINSVTLDSESLYNGSDYTIESEFGEVDAGEYFLTISGCGNYTGNASASHKILKKTPERYCFNDFQIDEYDYNGSPQSVSAPTLNSPYTGCGEITLYYENENYKKSSQPPTDCGTYTILFDVAEGKNFKAETDIVYGDLRILKVHHDDVYADISVAPGVDATYDLSRYIEDGGSVYATSVASGEEIIDSYSVDGSKIQIKFPKDLQEGEFAEFKFTIDGCTNYDSYFLVLKAVASHKHELTKVPAKEATCEEAGNIEYYICTIDGCDQLFKDAEGKEPLASLEDTIVPALGHDWDEWKVTKKPTDKDPGVKTRTCKRCRATETEELPPVVTPGKVVINTGGVDTVYTGETLNLTATVVATIEGKDASQEVIWTSSNAKVAQVNEEGVVTGIANGSVTITAACVEKPSVKASVKLFVKTRITELKLVLPTANLPDDTNTNTGRLQTGKTMTATAVFNEGVDKADRGLVWYSEDSTVASVNQKGVITAKAASDEPVMITAASTIDETRIATCFVTVYDPVTAIKLNKSALTIGVGETYAGLTVSFAPANASVQEWIYTYPESGIIEVSRVTVNGVDSLQVKGLKAGKTKITVKAADGSNKEATCNVTVGNAVSSISIAAPKSQNTLAAGKTLKFTVSFNGGDKKNQPVNKDIEWKITSELDKNGNNASGRIATVDQKGTLKGLAAGTVKVSAVHAESGKMSGEYEVRIFVPMTKLSISESKVTISEDKGTEIPKTYQLLAAVTPDQATLYNGTKALLTANDGLEWAVAKADIGKDGKPIVTVDETGKLTVVSLPDGKTKASATIKVTAKSDSGKDSPLVKSAQCVVTVVKEVKVSKVSLNATKLAAGVGSTYTLKADVAPHSADNTDVTWECSDPESIEVTGDGASAKVIVKKTPADNKPVTITVSAADGSKKSAKCTVTVGNPVKENGVAITQTEAQKRLVVGKTTTLKSVVSCDTTGNAKAKPANAAVTWEVTKAFDAEGNDVPADKLESIATVSDKGVVKAVSCGRVEITATSKETPVVGSPAKASVEICTYIPVTKLAISQTKRTIGEGKTGYLWISDITPGSAFDPADSDGIISWTVSDESTVAIAAYTKGTDPAWAATANTVKGQKLVFKALKQTKKAVVIKGTTNDGSKKSVTCQVTVLGSVKDEDVKLLITKKSVAAALQKEITVSPAYDTGSKELTVTGLPAGKTVKLVPQVTATASDKSVTYRSSNTYVATVSTAGVITARHSGTAVISMTTSDSGKTATCTVTIP